MQRAQAVLLLNSETAIEAIVALTNYNRKRIFDLRKNYLKKGIIVIQDKKKGKRRDPATNSPVPQQNFMKNNITQSKKTLLLSLALVIVILSVGAIILLRKSVFQSTEKPFSYIVGVDKQTENNRQERLTEYKLRNQNGHHEIVFSLPVNQRPSNIINGRIIAFEELEGQLSFFKIDLTQNPLTREPLFFSRTT